jgi:hypothetical protein
MKGLFLCFTISVLALSFPGQIICSMSSPNYFIYADSIETGGGLSAGGVYSIEDTTGESPAGFINSAIYEIRSGYQHMERGYLSFTISENNINLGTLNTSAVNSASTTLMVSTDSVTGYDMFISSVAGTMIAAVIDGTVTAGHEEYGFSAFGPESQIIGDVAPVAATLIASTSSPIYSSEIVMTFKASMSSATVSGNYNQSIVVSASANI